MTAEQETAWIAALEEKFQEGMSGFTERHYLVMEAAAYLGGMERAAEILGEVRLVHEARSRRTKIEFKAVAAGLVRPD